MGAGIIPVSNVINVSITNTPSGLAERNVNSLALFTNETSSLLNDYDICISAAQVAAIYGTNSVTAQMANAIFAQTPNIRTGGGRLIVVPMQGAVSATPASVDTADLSANLASLIAVTNGDLRVTLSGTNFDLTGLNFTACATFADIATVIQKKLVNATVTNVSTTGLRFTNKRVGTDATVVLAAVPAGSGTNLAAAGYLNVAAAVTTAGTNSSGETLLQAITRVQDSVSFVGFMTNLNLEGAVITATATAVQAMDRMFLHHTAAVQDVTGICATIKNAAETKTRMLLYTAGTAEANLYKAAYAGRAFSVNFSGSRTSQTMNLKQLATITPDAGLTQTIYDSCNTNGVDVYVSYDGVPSVYNTSGNDFFDNPYSDLALKFALETSGFNYLRQTNTKVPQTETGMNGLKSAYGQTMQRFVTNGVVAPGSWTSSETFGDPETFKQNISDRGYYIYSLPVAQQSSADRDARKAPLVQIAVKRAGAIHSSDVIVLIND